VAIQTKDKFFIGCIAFLAFVCIASIAWGIILDNKIRTDPNKKRVTDLAARIIDLESELRSGRDSLDKAIRESEELKRLNIQITDELDGYRKRIDIGSGAIGRGSDAVERIESIVGQIETRGIME